MRRRSPATRASAYSPVSTNMAVHIAKDSVLYPSHVVAPLSALNSEHGDVNVDMPVNCSTKCPSGAIDVTASTSVYTVGADPINLIHATAMSSTTDVVHSSADDRAPSNCLMKRLSNHVNIMMSVAVYNIMVPDHAPASSTSGDSTTSIGVTISDMQDVTQDTGFGPSTADSLLPASMLTDVLEPTEVSPSNLLVFVELDGPSLHNMFNMDIPVQRSVRV
jgi:hypothetical protein